MGWWPLALLLGLGVLLLVLARTMEWVASDGKRRTRTGAVGNPGKASAKGKTRRRGKGGASRVPSDENMGILEAPVGGAESGEGEGAHGGSLLENRTSTVRPADRLHKGSGDSVS